MIIDCCPHCQTKHVQCKVIYSGSEIDFNSPEREVWQILQCQNNKCSRFILNRVSTQNSQSLGIFPAQCGDLPESIPKLIRDDFKEAVLCIQSGCYKASMVMGRRALQNCLKDQGCKDHNLVDAIKSAVKNGILRKAFHALADEIREFGNLSAHPDDDQLENCSKENAEIILGFVQLITEEFYDLPQKADLLKQKRVCNS